MAKGSKELNKYLSGGKLSVKQALLAKCLDCMGFYIDGKNDCVMPDCPLYPWMPYGVVWMGRQKGKRTGIIPPGIAKHRLQKQGKAI